MRKKGSENLVKIEIEFVDRMSMITQFKINGIYAITSSLKIL